MYTEQILNVFFILYFFLFTFQNEFHIGLDLSEARASLLSGDVVELTNATSSEPTSMKLVWEVNTKLKPFLQFFEMERRSR